MRHIDGFEQFSNENQMTNALTRSGYAVGGTWADVAGRGRFSRALSGVGTRLVRTVAWTEDNITVGFAHEFSGRGSVCWLKAGAFDVTLSMNGDTGLALLGTAQGGAIPAKNRYYYYELHVNRTEGFVRLYINGKLDVQFTPGPSAALTNATDLTINLGYRDPGEYMPVPAPDGNAKTYDDLYIREDEPIGPIMITTRFPTHDDAIAWQKAGDQPTHAATVAMKPPEPLDVYIASDQYGATDIFSSSQAMSNDHPVIASGLVVLARKSPTFLANLAVSMDGSITNRSGFLEVGENWISQYLAFDVEEDPVNIVNSHFAVTVVSP